jgi:hypothetical protein
MDHNEEDYDPDYPLAEFDDLDGQLQRFLDETL